MAVPAVPSQTLAASAGPEVTAQTVRQRTVGDMSAASRRKARRIRNDRQANARARVQNRPSHHDPRLGDFSGPWTRKDREELRWPGPSRKQSDKHRPKKNARRRREIEARYTRVLSCLQTEVSGPVTVTSLAFFGSSVPFIAEGAARTPDGQDVSWHLRFRFDRAFLEIGLPDPETGLIGDCLWAASRDDVTGNPYAGFLTEEQGIALLVKMFAEADAPEPGTRFRERLRAAIDLISGRDDLARQDG